MTQRTHLARLSVLLAVLIAVAVSAAIVYGSLGKPYVMDEMEFPSVAQAIAETGKPVYYRGEALPANVGLWHPPLYILWYAGWMKLFGASTISGRLFGLANLWATLAIVGGFIWARWSASAGRTFSGLIAVLVAGLGIAATSPLLVQGAILPDIDTQVLPLTLTAMLLAMFELRRRGWRGRAYWAAFTMGCVVQLYAKLPALLLIIPTFAVFELVRAAQDQPVLRARFRRRRSADPSQPASYRMLLELKLGARVVRGPALVIGGLALAALILAITWFVIAAAWGVSFSRPFTYLTQSTNNPANFAGSGGFLATVIANAPEHFGFAVQWIGIPMLAGLALLVVREFGAPPAGMLSQPERAALYTFVLVLLALYIVLRPAPFSFPKYYPPMIPSLAILALDVIAALQSGRRPWLTAALFGGLTVAYLIAFALNPLTAGQDFILGYYTTWPKSGLVRLWMWLPLVVSAIITGLIAWRTRGRLIELLALGAFAVAFGWQINVVAMQARAPYSTTYHYGELGFDAAIWYLRRTLPTDAVLVAPKDLGFYLQDRWRYYELPPDPRPLIERPDLQFLVFREFDYYGNTIRDTPEIAAAVDAHFAVETRVGPFVVMRRREA